jgi:NitT/TauT family transport system substrate-binding protein
MRRAVLAVLLAVAFVSAGFAQPTEVESAKVPVLRVGHVGHDHQCAPYVAALAGESFKELYGIWFKEIRPKDLYELYDGDELIAEVEFYKAGGGSKMPTMMSQGAFDVGFGGVAAVSFFVDKGAPMKMIAPLHFKGDMLVVKPDLDLNSWEEFVAWLEAQDHQVSIGYKNPVAVAKLVFQRALDEAGITHTGDKANTDAQVLLVNMKGEKNLIPGLMSGQIQAYVSNNPWCAIAEDKGVGQCVTELHDLPPGVFRDHPCCCVAANMSAMEAYPEEIGKFLELMTVSTHFVNTEREKATEYVAQWIGTTPEVEMISMATSGYSLEPDEAFYNGMWVWYEEMVGMEKITDQLKDKTREEFEKMVYDFSLLETALKAAAERIK